MEENTFKSIPSGDEFFQHLTDLLPDAYLLLSAKGAVVAGNLAARKFFPTQQLNATTLHALVIDAPAKVDRALERWAGSGSLMPTSLTRHDGSVLRCDGARIRSALPGSLGCILVRCMPRSASFVTRAFVRQSVEYTELQKRVAEKLAQAKRTKETLETTAAVFAHEIANPLNGVATSLDLLQLELKDSPLAPAVADLLNAAKKEIARTAGLLNAFRALARPQVVNLQPTELKQVLEDVLAPELPVLRNSGIEFTADFDPALPAVLGDRNKLKQAILNVCKNAVEAMPAGGRLKISTYVSDGVAAVDIADSGVGIAKDFDPFQVFHSTKAKGTGLGLAIAAQIIAAHKGRIEYASEPGCGTTFTFYLPICGA